MVHICHHRKSAHKVAEFLTFGVGISSTYAAGPGRIHLSSLRCLTVHFSARIFDLERYESRWSEEKERGRGVALIHSTVSASLSVRPTPGQLLASPHKEGGLPKYPLFLHF